MDKLQKDLISISKALTVLTEKVEKLADAFENEAIQANPVKKTAVKKKVVAKKKLAAKKAAKKAAPEAATSKAAEPTEASGEAKHLSDILTNK